MDVDLVVLWVDGTDTDWVFEKNKYSKKKIDDSNNINRFRDWGLMKYWFRGIDKFIPWFRKIHFVTWGHLPKFLNTNNPKLHIVNHKDYIPLEWLPTFSANPLEMNLHRIPDLAEHFIYFNDDMFVLRPMSKKDFFVGDLPCYQATEIPLMFVGQTEIWQLIAANDLGIINKWFPKQDVKKKELMKFINIKYHWYDNLRTGLLGLLFPQCFLGFKNFHCPAAFLKCTFEDIWEREPELLEKTSSHRFRDREDVNQWLAIWWQIVTGKFYPRRINNYVGLINNNTIGDLCNIIKKQSYEMICLNDPSNIDDYEYLSIKLQQAFEEILPEKCDFER